MAQSVYQTPRRVNENNSNAVFLNGKSVQRNDTNKRKTALGDIKNYAPMTPGIGRDKKSANSLNDDQLNFLTDCDTQLSPADYCSSKPVDYERLWAERLLLTDAEVNCVLSKACYRDDDRDLLPPPPPSPEDVEILAPPEYFRDVLELLPPPLDFDGHLPPAMNIDGDESALVNSNDHTNDGLPLNHSIFEFSDTDLSFDDLSDNFAGRMHF